MRILGNVKVFSFEMLEAESEIKRQGFTWKKTRVMNVGMLMCLLFSI